MFLSKNEIVKKNLQLIRRKIDKIDFCITKNAAEIFIFLYRKNIIQKNRKIHTEKFIQKNSRWAKTTAEAGFNL